jgi:ssDNA-binding Zn-finger/Zn-ribbon topoisomerase 1
MTKPISGRMHQFYSTPEEVHANVMRFLRENEITDVGEVECPECHYAYPAERNEPQTVCPWCGLLWQKDWLH